MKFKPGMIISGIPGRYDTRTLLRVLEVDGSTVKFEYVEGGQRAGWSREGRARLERLMQPHEFQEGAIWCKITRPQLRVKITSVRHDKLEYVGLPHPLVDVTKTYESSPARFRTVMQPYSDYTDRLTRHHFFLMSGERLQGGSFEQQ